MQSQSTDPGLENSKPIPRIALFTFQQKLEAGAGLSHNITMPGQQTNSYYFCDQNIIRF